MPVTREPSRFVRAIALVCVLCFLTPLAAEAGLKPIRAHVPADLVEAATTNPDALFNVIVQGRGRERTTDVAADVSAEIAANRGRERGLKRRFVSISGVSAQLTGKQILRLATRTSILAITRDAPMRAADAPAATSPPTVSGTPRVGETLTAAAGEWAGVAPLAFAYQWQRCDLLGVTCTDVTGATAETYALAIADLGATVRVVVTATDEVGSTAAASAATAEVLPALPPPPVLEAPASTDAPTIAGAPAEGATLTATAGTWSGTPPIAYAYRWQRCDAAGLACADIGGATGSTYSLTAADAGSTVRVVVDATNGGGSGSRASEPTAVVAAAPAVAPANTTVPDVAGEPVVGGTLTSSAGGWSGTLPLAHTYQWERCGAVYRPAAVLAGAPAAYWPLDGTAADASGNGLGGSSVGGVTTSAGVTGGAIDFDGSSGYVDVPGVGNASFASGFTLEAWVRADAVGQADRGIIGKWNYAGEGGVLLWIDVYGKYGLAVTGQPANYLTTGVSPSVDTWEHLVGTWDGTTLRLYRNGVEIGTKAFAGALGDPTTSFQIGNYAGAARYLDGAVDEAALYGRALSSDEVEHRYLGCEAIAGATAPAFTPTAGELDARARVVVTATNTAGSSSAASARTTAVAAAAEDPVAPANTALPTIAGDALEGSTLTAAPGAWTGTGPLTFDHRWERCDAAGLSCVDIPDATVSTYALVAADLGATIRVAITASGTGGTATARSDATAVVAPTPPIEPVPDPAVAPASTAPPTVGGQPLAGSTLTAAPGAWSGTAPLVYSYQWERCGPGYPTGAVLSDGPLGFWRLEESGGTSAADTAGSREGTYRGTVTYGVPGVTGGSDSAVRFTGATGSVAVPGVTDAALADGFTLEAWVKVASAQADRGIVGKWSYPEGGRLLWIDGSGHYGLAVTTASSNYLSSPAEPTIGAWEHVVGTWNGQMLRLYVNGELVDSKAFSDPAGSAPDDLQIGDYPGPGKHLNGTVDEVAVYGRALTASEVHAHFAGCETIAGATAPTYDTGAGDVGSTARVVVTATNEAGSRSTASAATATLTEPPVAPANTTPPTVAGEPVEGGTLTAAAGSWSGTLPLAYTYRWQRCDPAGLDCVDIAGAESTMYTAAAADVGATLRAAVTATNDAGSASTPSAATAAVTAAPALPTIAGEPVEGATLTTEPGGSSYQWRLCDPEGLACTDIAGATEASYTVTAADVGGTIRVAVGTAVSNPTAVVAASVVNTAPPTLSGIAAVGATLTAERGTWTGAAPLTYAYLWQRCDTTGLVCDDLAGATSASYTATAADQGTRLRVVVAASNATGSGSKPSAASAVVGPRYSSEQLWPYASGAATVWPQVAAGGGPLPPAIAIVDSGIEASRPDFGGRVIHEVTLTARTPNSPGDGKGHGTFVASIAAGGAHRWSGAAPNANLVSIDVMDDAGVATTSDVIAAADWITQNKDAYNIRVANFSLTGSVPTNIQYDPLDRAVERLWLSGVVVVAAAGNYAVDGAESGVPFAPGNDPFVITVGAVDLAQTLATSDDFTAPWSAFGYTPDGFAKPELGAPGRYMIGAVPPASTLALERPTQVVEPGYMQLSGTSFSAPVVAGVAAELLAAHPTWTPAQVKGALMLTAQPLPAAIARSTGVGELSAAAALAVTDPPNANLALDAFLIPDPGGSPIPVFDTAAWGQTASSDPAWASAAWGQAAWGQAAWGQAAWGQSYWSSDAASAGITGNPGDPGSAETDVLPTGSLLLSPADMALALSALGGS